MTTSRIIVDPKVMMGKPVIKGTRVTVEAVLKKLSHGFSPKEIVKEFPRVTEEDVKAVLEYAAATVQNEEIHLISKGR